MNVGVHSMTLTVSIYDVWRPWWTCIGKILDPPQNASRLQTSPSAAQLDGWGAIQNSSMFYPCWWRWVSSKQWVFCYQLVQFIPNWGWPHLLVQPISNFSGFRSPHRRWRWLLDLFSALGAKNKKSLTQKDSIQRVVHLSLFFAPFLEHTWFLAFLVFEPTNEGFVKRCWSLGASETNYVFSKWPC